MFEILRSVASLAVLVFAISSTLAAGLSFTFRDVVAPFKSPMRIVRAVIANFVLVPLLAVVIAHTLSLNTAQTIGLVLLGAAGGAPFLIKLTAVAAGDVALSTSLLLLLVPMTVVLMPVIVPLLVPEAAVSAGAIALPLFATLLVPLGIGLVIKQFAARWASPLQRLARPVSTVALLALLVLTTLVNLPSVLAIIASPAVIAILLLLAGSFLIGYTIASPRRERRIVLALGTAQRGIAAATIVAVEDIKDPDTLVLVVVASVIDLAILIPLARLLRTRSTRHMEALDDTHASLAPT